MIVRRIHRIFLDKVLLWASTLPNQCENSEAVSPTQHRNRWALSGTKILFCHKLLLLSSYLQLLQLFSFISPNYSSPHFFYKTP